MTRYEIEEMNPPYNYCSPYKDNLGEWVKHKEAHTELVEAYLGIVTTPNKDQELVAKARDYLDNHQILWGDDEGLLSRYKLEDDMGWEFCKYCGSSLSGYAGEQHFSYCKIGPVLRRNDIPFTFTEEA